VPVGADPAQPWAKPGGRAAQRSTTSSDDVTKLYVGVGRGDGVRPQDLVGAFAGETDLDGSDIGAIRIFDRFSLVEVPSSSVDHVIERMKRTTIKGKKPPVRPDRGDHP
jgi:ATP-dependent RNA helicase DeaD